MDEAAACVHSHSPAARQRVHQRQPLGVVGIIGPWNYPLQLTLGPLATALAAGNRAMIKPSELPHAAQPCCELLHSTFVPTRWWRFRAGQTWPTPAVPFDHLMFTGSTAVGRKVAEAAARNLTPTTLELGGKARASLMRLAAPQTWPVWP